MNVLLLTKISHFTEQNINDKMIILIELFYRYEKAEIFSRLSIKTGKSLELVSNFPKTLSILSCLEITRQEETRPRQNHSRVQHYHYSQHILFLYCSNIGNQCLSIISIQHQSNILSDLIWHNFFFFFLFFLHKQVMQNSSENKIKIKKLALPENQTTAIMLLILHRW